ncbi:Retrovirus-related Pol polyprotein from transposon RE1 [Vitis vinifera]|uniref:Retrovirus-related Pol polyprotein from transposon RE1 n=1 Tax=Vitis vinifera TaxID=29760 RepID=A0A438H8P6_VITVI|nr:Retrovirus-related Pol polyprotein from transposon RE1 [Vitis vinifera]
MTGDQHQFNNFTPCQSLSPITVADGSVSNDLQLNTMIGHGSELGGVYYLTHDSLFVAAAAERFLINRMSSSALGGDIPLKDVTLFESESFFKVSTNKLSVPLPTPLYTSIPPSKPLQVYTRRKALQTPCAPDPSPTPIRFALSFSSVSIPKDYQEAIQNHNWKKAMDKEMSALLTRGTWDLVPLLEGVHPAACRWIFTVKYSPNGFIERYKARLVAKGYTQTQVNKDWLMCQLDIKNTFLYGDMTKEQSPRAWFDKFSQVVFVARFRRSQADHSVFVPHSSSSIVVLIVYVEDILVRKYAADLLQETGLLGAKPADVPMEPNLDLWKEDEDFEDSAWYRRLVGKLIYLTVTRPNIVHVVGLISQFMEKPKKCHWEAAYVNYAGNKGDRKSTSSYCTFVGGNLVTWKSKKQIVVSRSSVEAEYCAMAHTTCELIWLKALPEDFGITCTDPIPMHCDNQAAIHIVSNPVFHERTKHIEVDCHFVRNVVTSKKICTPFTPSKDQVADMFTKALKKDDLNRLSDKLHMMDIYAPA